jgi:protocatechuate 3,4-dioxygenase beta subunit
MTSQSDQPNQNKSESVEAGLSRRNLIRTAGLILGGTAVGGAISGWPSAEAATSKNRTTTRKKKVTTARKTGAASPVVTTRALSAAANCSVISQETGGPFPGDGTNGINALTMSGIVRSDIRPSFGSSSRIAKGVSIKIRLTINSSETCAALAGSAVYIWQCDQTGNYSLYSQATVNENYLRGVQVADSKGIVEFVTIFPGAYPGRWPHIHFEVYPSLAKTTNGANAIGSSQLAFPEAVCRDVFATKGYEASVPQMSRTTLQNDMVFSDGVDDQLAAISGTITSGLTASLTINVDPKG